MLRTGIVAAIILAAGIAGAKKAKTKAAPPAKAAVAEVPAPEVDQGRLEAHLKAKFPKKVIEPAIVRTLTKLFGDDEAGKEKATHALEASLFKQASVVRGILSQMIDALVAQDRKTYMELQPKFTAGISSRAVFWDGAVAGLVKELSERAGPLARVAVGRYYDCDAQFLGTALGYAKDAKKAAAIARKLGKPVRRLICDMVRRWAEKQVVAEVQTTLQGISSYLRTNERGDLSDGAEEQARLIGRVLERQLLRFVGEYQADMFRIQRALDLLAQAILPPPGQAGQGEQPSQ